MISDPSPPTPTKEELVRLPWASRHSKPTCLHYGIDKHGRSSRQSRWSSWAPGYYNIYLASDVLFFYPAITRKPLCI
jgi:hypothetical protein